MKVFISWSGGLSHAMAKALQDWLPNVIQAIKPFLSSEDIQKGARWFDVIGTQLEQTHFGILCLTRANLTAPWILFEAGALSKQLDLARVVPLLVDLKPADVKPPLSQFNAVVSPTKDELEKLLKTMNAILDENRLSDSQLGKAFTREWPEMEAQIKKVEELATKSPAPAPQRSDRDILEEILQLVRNPKAAPRFDPKLSEKLFPYVSMLNPEALKNLDIVFTDPSSGHVIVGEIKKPPEKK